jgi:excisionase family DNA binding protein
VFSTVRQENDSVEKLLTVREVAEYLDVTEETVRRWLRTGRLDGVLLSRKSGWRIRPEAVERMLSAPYQRFIERAGEDRGSDDAKGKAAARASLAAA